MKPWKIEWKPESYPIYNFRVGRKYITLYENMHMRRDICRLKLTPEIQNILEDMGLHWDEADEHRMMEVLWLMKARMHDVLKQKGLFSVAMFDGACSRFLG